MLFDKKLIVLHQGDTLCIKLGIQKQGTQGMGEGGVMFRGISPNIPGNIAKHSGECSQTFWGMSPNIPGNIAEHSGECPIYFDGRELVEASSITIVFSVALLILCSAIFCVKNLARLLAARLNSSESLISLP